jgi:hypothetical protein
MSIQKRTTTSGSSRRKPPGTREPSFLIAETKAMDRNRRLAEQQGERKLGSVKARDHAPEHQSKSAPEGELQNNLPEHPEFTSQRFDGIDSNNPEPPLNTAARREFDNERREQEQEKQLRLGNMPKMGSAPKPPGPR